MRSIPEKFFKSNAFKPGKIFSTSSMSAIMDTVRMTNSIAFMPKYMIDRYSGSHDFAYLRINGTDLHMDLAVVHQPFAQLSPAAISFVTFVKSLYL